MSPALHTHALSMHSAFRSHSLKLALLFPHAALGTGKNLELPRPKTSPKSSAKTQLEIHKKNVQNSLSDGLESAVTIQMKEIIKIAPHTSPPTATPATCPCDMCDLLVTHTPLSKSGTG